jgi:hypothetical protein
MKLYSEVGLLVQNFIFRQQVCEDKFWSVFILATNTLYIVMGFQWEVGLPDDNTQTNADVQSYVKQALDLT